MKNMIQEKIIISYATEPPILPLTGARTPLDSTNEAKSARPPTNTIISIIQIRIIFYSFPMLNHSPQNLLNKHKNAMNNIKSSTI